MGEVGRGRVEMISGREREERVEGRGGKGGGERGVGRMEGRGGKEKKRAEI